MYPCLMSEIMSRSSYSQNIKRPERKVQCDLYGMECVNKNTEIN